MPHSEEDELPSAYEEELFACTEVVSCAGAVDNDCSGAGTADVGCSVAEGSKEVCSEIGDSFSTEDEETPALET